MRVVRDLACELTYAPHGVRNLDISRRVMQITSTPQLMDIQALIRQDTHGILG